MPPKKKATAAAADATASTGGPTARPASSRATRATTKATKPSSTTAKPASKPKSTDSAGKRARGESDDEADGPSKKTKTDDTEDAKDEDAPKKLVTVLKRGAAPVDPASKYVNTHQVYSNTACVWDAMLNQTEVGSNKNKFYVIQLLHPIGNDSFCFLHTRWGRVGENGQSQTKGPWPPANALIEFKKVFKSKTGTDWENRQGMLPKKGKYVWLERSFEEDGEEDKANTTTRSDDRPIPSSKLDPAVQALCRLIFSIKLIDAHLSSMNYDANKLPLGKLAKSTILNGFAALKKISDLLDKPNGDLAKELGGLRMACEQISGEYYSIIPHAFGRNRPTVIDDMILLKRELELVDALGDMEIAQKLITTSVMTDEVGNELNQLDAHFRSLGLSYMKPVQSGTKEFNALALYASETHGATHMHYRANILYAFRVERQLETEAWVKGGYDKLGEGQRLLLWHGSRTTNFAGILKQGLRIAPPEAPVTGYMFGKGVYFADMMSKSANYCYAHLSESVGLLLLCEVAAKPIFEQLQSNYNADRDCKANNKLATLGVGRSQPVHWKDAGEALDNDDLQGCHMPKGPAVNVGNPNVCLEYNEYIVYDPSQIRVRYLLMVQMG